MAIKIEMLRYFACVAQTGSLSEAADILGRTPSALSMMLKQFEEHLGEPLFETDRKSKLTTLGVFVLEQAERELQQFDNTVLDILSFAKAKSGMVRVAAVPSVANTLLPSVIARFIEDHPDVQIDVRDMDSASVLRELAKDRIDFGIASNDGSRNVFQNQELLSDDFGVVAHVSNPLVQQDKPINWSQLRNENLIANSLSASIKVEACRELHANARLSVQNITSLLAMVRHRIGITILPEMTAKMFNSPEIVFKALDEQNLRRRIQMIRKPERAISPAARVFEQQILKSVAAQSFEF